MPDISGINPDLPLNHLRMTIGTPTINFAQYRAPFVGTINTNTITSAIADISGELSDRFDDPNYYRDRTP